MKQHLEDDDLILHFYGESGAVAEPHLADCAGCRTRYQTLQSVLNSVQGDPTPHRDASYEDDVWRRLEPKIGARVSPGKRLWEWLSPRYWAPALAAAVLLVVVFFAGRYSQPQTPVTPDVTQLADAESAVRGRILLGAVGGHLMRSKVLLTEIANADPGKPLGFVEAREIARDLVYANRLYRQTAETAGDAGVVGLLDELERVFLEMAHGPEEMQEGQLEDLRERIRNESLIFKIRVTGSRLTREDML